MLRKMGPVYPVLDTEEPPEETPEEKRKERGRKEEERCLEEAWREVQRESEIAMGYEIQDAVQDYRREVQALFLSRRREVQAAKERFEIRTESARIPEVPGCPEASVPFCIIQGSQPTACHQDPDSYIGKPENITDDENDFGTCQHSANQFVQFEQKLPCDPRKFRQKGPFIPETAHKCVTKIGQGIANLNDLKPQHSRQFK